MYFLSYSINLYILFFRYKLEIVGGMGPTVGLVSCRVDQFYVAAANEKFLAFQFLYDYVGIQQ